MVYAANTDQDPTPEFNQDCLSVIRRWESGDLPFKEAVAQVAAKIQEAVNDGHLANQGRAEHAMGYLQHYRGDLNASIRHYERARQLFQKVGNARRVATMDLNNGENYRLKGDFVRARRLYRTAYDAARELSMLRIQAMAALNEGLTLLAVEQYTAADKLFQESLALLQDLDEEPKPNGMLCELYLGLTSIYLHHHQIEEAWQTAQEALHYAHNATEKMQLGAVYRSVGEVLTHLDEPQNVAAESANDPDEYFRRAMEVFRELHMEAEIARTIFAHAQSMAHRGRKTTAARKLQQVMIMFTELGMVDDAAKAAAAQLTMI
jgi:tetratricopeptide (TPR) repeat protein